MAVESRFPLYTTLEDRSGYKSITVSVPGKSTWTDSVISDMLDSAAVRQEPRVSHVDVAASHAPETKVEKDKDGKDKTVETGRVIWTRNYYFHPNPLPDAQVKAATPPPLPATAPEAGTPTVPDDKAKK